MDLTKAEILLDSIVNGVRVTSLEIITPRIILPEINTHRVFSRNYQSSRAVPQTRQAEWATFTPQLWRVNGKGMVPTEFADEETSKKADEIWERAREANKGFSKELADLGIHKELANRPLEPFLFIPGVLTSTRWDNFFSLRCDEAAQHEFKILAKAIRAALLASKPVERDYHFPYILDIDDQKSWTEEDIFKRVKMSVARCARVSYKLFDGNESKWEEDITLYNKLLVSRPVHGSPAENIVVSPKMMNNITFALLHKGEITMKQLAAKKDPNYLCGNFHPGVVQYRKIIEEVFDK